MEDQKPAVVEKKKRNRKPSETVSVTVQLPRGLFEVLEKRASDVKLSVGKMLEYEQYEKIKPVVGVYPTEITS